MDTKADNKCLS